MIRRRRAPSGFTVLELLVVLGVIALLGAGAAVLALQPVDERRLQAGEALAANLFQAARLHAVAEGTAARVIVLDQPENSGLHLRYLGIVTRDPDDPARWQACSGGVLLPAAVAWSETRSRADGSIRLEYPLAESQSEGTGPRWHYYEFDARGLLTADTIRLFALRVGHPSTEEVAGAVTSGIGGFAIFPGGAIAFSKPGASF